MSKKEYLFDHKSNALKRNDYRPSEYLIPKTELHFDLDDTQTVVSSKMSITRNPALKDVGGPLVLDGEDMKLISIKINGQDLDRADFTVTKDKLFIKRPPAGDFTLEIQNEVNPSTNMTLSGLYKSGSMLSTQCEAQGFRRITYYLDRPDILSKFTTTVEGDKEKFPLLLSNGNGDPKDTTDLGNGKHSQTWQDPFPKPAYLFALVAGDLEYIEDTFTTMSGRTIDLRIFVDKGYEDKIDWAMESTKRAMKWDEDTYGREYDLDTFHIVGTAKFNFGAMENKGLNIYNLSALVGDKETSTDSKLVNIEAILAHEYFHNWSGNRVTLRDWFELTLKEGLTVLRDGQFTADMYSATNKWIAEADLMKSAQFTSDAGPTAHPIRPEFVEEFDNIYTTTIYEKGSHVLRMLNTIMGPQTWRKGTDEYFSRFDGQAVTCDDFVNVMEDISGMDLSQFREWYSQSGTPEIEYKGAYDASTKTYKLTLSQNTPPTQDQADKVDLFIPISVGLIAPSGKDVDLGDGDTTKVLHLTKKEQVFEFHNIPEGVTPSILRNFSAPVKLKTQAPDSELIFRMVHDSDGYNRNEAAAEFKMKTVLDVIKQVQNGQKPKLNQEFIDAYGVMLDSALGDDQAFAANLLQLPGYTVITQEVSVIDPDAIMDGLKAVKKELHSTFKDKFETLYNATETPANEDYQVNHEQIGRRALHNTALSYLTTPKDENALKLAKSQYDNATNMTARYSALANMTKMDTPETAQALGDFYNKFKDDSNVIDTWLALYGTMEHGDSLQRVKDMMEHEAFDKTNPNKVRHLVSTFGGSNPRHFHNKDGSGYKFFGDMIIEMNSINPRMAAGLCGVFMQWTRYDDTRKALMKEQLERIQATPDLHAGANELIGKALAAEKKPSDDNIADPKKAAGL